MFHVFGTLENRELLKFVFVFRVIGGHIVDSGERRLLFLQIIKKALYFFLFSFNNDFCNRVPSISYVADQFIFYGDPIDKRSKTYPLNDAADLGFGSQPLVNSHPWQFIICEHVSGHSESWCAK